MTTNSLDRAHYHLEGWGEWRRKNIGQVGRGYPSRSAGIAAGGHSEQFDHLVEREDSRCAAICDQIIDDLQGLHRAALEAEYIFRRMFKSNRLNASEILESAKAAFWEKARRSLT